jgi:DNA polymerase I-like protein with 3'-5' exonuclease and polymerase domains
LKAVLDIETDGLDAKRIHLVVCKDLDTGWIHYFREWDKAKLQSFLDRTECLIMHNGISFDMPVLQKLWNIKYPYAQIIDTLIAAQLNNPIREGGNSLANWGDILKFPKMTPPESFKEYTAEMHQYCIRDVEVTEKVYLHLREAMRGWSKHCVKLEHSVRRLLDLQKNNGFFIDQEKVLSLLAVLDDESGILNEKLVDTFEPTIEVMKTKTKIHPFNPQSRQQIGDRLMKRGWKPTQFTEKTGKPVVNEGTLKECTIPEAEDIRRYMLLRKRSAQASSWVKAINQDTGRVHGNVITIGAVTNRMSHNSPNMAQIPAVYSPYGPECRECWTVEHPMTHRLVGADASGLELRCLAHYIDDKDYIDEILNGDIHSANQRMAGLETRDQAKTFIYAFLYGAGSAKIGSVVGKDAGTGQRLIDKFLSSMPKLSRFRERTILEAESTNMVKGLDGRYFHIKSSHSAVNTLLQGAGAIICKEWLCHITHKVKTKGLDANPVANIHDEVQFEVHKNDAEEFCNITKIAMKDTEKSLDVRCPLDSEAKIGSNWAETH